LPGPSFSCQRSQCKKSGAGTDPRRERRVHGFLSVAAAEEKIGLAQQKISRWRKRLADREVLRSRVTPISESVFCAVVSSDRTSAQEFSKRGGLYIAGPRVTRNQGGMRSDDTTTLSGMRSALDITLSARWRQFFDQLLADAGAVNSWISR
jgi:hypothetical protein